MYPQVVCYSGEPASQIYGKSLSLCLVAALSSVQLVLCEHGAEMQAADGSASLILMGKQEGPADGSFPRLWSCTCVMCLTHVYLRRFAFLKELPGPLAVICTWLCSPAYWAAKSSNHTMCIRPRGCHTCTMMHHGDHQRLTVVRQGKSTLH